ncbi:MAG TPA: type 1 glutamine amidotransferase [Segeticoccus sp.]|nr:type 1 glutamine amidotransferase [Segeticoccus sp.]
MSVHLLVIQHEDDCPPEWFGDWWSEVGLPCETVAAHRGAPIPSELGDTHVGLVVLGGEMGANDDDRHPWLAPTRALVARTVEQGRPFLGICLGHQLGAVALGGTVERNVHGQATGLTPVRLTEEGAADELLGAAVRDGSPAIMWNGDVVTTLPPGATRLATAPDGTVQAARFADNAWGLQFHPECSPEQFRRWTTAEPSAEEARPDGVDVAAVAQEIDHAEATLRRAWAPLARRFAELARRPVSRAAR